MKIINIACSVAITTCLAFTVISCNNDSDTKNENGGPTTLVTDSTDIPNNTNASMDTMNASKTPDQQLVYELIESMYAGIALMKDGETKATDPAVKSLAMKLDKEHSAMTKELEALSNQKSWPLPSGEPAADKSKREEMSKEDASTYQKEWLSSLRERHETNIKKIEDAKPTDADVKAAGAKGLPKVKALLADIKAVQAKMK